MFFCRHKIVQQHVNVDIQWKLLIFFPCFDEGAKSVCRSLKQRRRFLQPGYTQIHQIPGIINHVFVPFGNRWFIFGWSITKKFWRGGSYQHWRTHFQSNHPNMRQWMMCSKVESWSWFMTTIFGRFVCQFCFFLKLDFLLELNDALKFQLRMISKCRIAKMIWFSLS